MKLRACDASKITVKRLQWKCRVSGINPVIAYENQALRKIKGALFLPLSSIDSTSTKPFKTKGSTKTKTQATEAGPRCVQMRSGKENWAGA